MYDVPEIRKYLKKFFKLNEYYTLLTIFSMSYHVLFFSFIKKFVF